MIVLLLSLLVAMFGLRPSRVVCEDTGDRLVKRCDCCFNLV